MVEIKCIISNQNIYVLIDPGTSLSCISPHVVEKCKIKSEKYKNSWLAQLPTREKRKVTN